MYSLRGFVAAVYHRGALESPAPHRRRVTPGRTLAMRVVLAFACMAILGSTDSVRAEPRISLNDISAAVRGTTPAPLQSADNGYSALLDFVQLTGAEAPTKVSATAPVDANHQFNDPDFAALQDFAQRLGTAQPESIKALPKVAEADNIFDALREGATPQTAPAPVTPRASKAATPKGHSAPVNATFIGEKACMTCHASHAAEFAKTLMGKIGKTQPGKFACESCHGPGSAHVKAGGGRGVGGIISFRPNDLSRTAEENNEICLACHQKGNRTNWHGSTHDERGLSCTNCHTIMKNVSRKSQLKTEFQPDTCFQCHKNKRAEMFRSSHMPVREGKMVCTDCHNPHGSYSESLLKTATVNEVCYKCHAEKRGPFLWEHPPVAESCLNCHDPHGSNNDFLLKVSRPRLCQQCHSGGQHNSNPRNPSVTLYAQGRECQNCHSNHHGSNNPAGARFMR